MLEEFPLLNQQPQIPESCYIDPSARINGAVQMGEFCSIWFQAAIRGDVNTIRLGNYTNIQDACVLHTTYRKYPLTIGDDVTFGHGVIAHGCTIGSRVLLGMQTLILDAAEIGDDVLIGAGSLVTEGKKIPSGVLAFGRPAKVIRDLTPEEVQNLKRHARHYANMAQAYREAGRWYGWQDNPFFPK